MKMQIPNLKDERAWRAITGLSPELFEKLLIKFEESYLEIYGSRLADRLQKTNIKYAINSEKDLLFFTLSSLKIGVTYDILAVLTDMNISNVKRNQERGLKVLTYALNKLGYMPLQSFESIEDFEEKFSGHSILLIDATEQRVEKPVNNAIQKEYYSSKNKSHTVKFMIIATINYLIMYVGAIHKGKKHDYKILKEEFSESNCFEKFIVKVDLGYQGINTDYNCKRGDIPHKKPPKKELTAQQKEENKQLARERITVEHCIGKLKRYSILKNKLRIKLIDLYEKIVCVCAGLWNFYISSKTKVIAN
jgi:hypothetical protein